MRACFRWLGALSMAAAVLATPLPLSFAQESGIGLVEVCRAGPDYTTTTGGICPARAWERPADGKAVLSCGTLTAGEACTWGHPELRYRLWEEIPDTMLVVTCAIEVPIGPIPAVDPCGTGGHATGKPRLEKRQIASIEPLVSGVGVASFTWVAPTQRIDGTELDGLSGYELGIGTTTGMYTVMRPIDDGSATSASIELELLEPQTVYFALRAIDLDGRMSDWSNEVSKTFVLEFENEPPRSPQLLEVTLEFSCVSADGRECRLVIN